MSGERRLDRRGFLARGLAAAGTALLGGCEGLSDQPWVRRVLDSAETLIRVTQEALLSPQALARVSDLAAMEMNDAPPAMHLYRLSQAMT
jgi:hypothetical protein